jgi:hypothetical protein
MNNIAVFFIVSPVCPNWARRVFPRYMGGEPESDKIPAILVPFLISLKIKAISGSCGDESAFYCTIDN